MPNTMLAASQETAYQLSRVALGEVEADLAIVNGDIVNVYTGEVLGGDTILIKGKRIAYVGKNPQSIGSDTRIIDAQGKTLIPGFIDGHTHVGLIFDISEMLRYCIKGGTTTVITESIDLTFGVGYRGTLEFLKATKNQPVKVLFTVPAMVSLSPLTREHFLTTEEVVKLLKRKEAVGLGESYWTEAIKGNEQLFTLIEAAKKVGKKLDGHTAGAKGNKLQAYTSLGITSCHEPTSAEETLERLRLGMYILIREGEIRRELEEIVKIKDENIDLRRLILATDGLGPWQFVADGYMEFVVQKAIDLGFDPVTAIRMATINVAQRFGLDDFIGGIAPGRHADILVIPNLNTIQPELVISNGQIIAQNGESLVRPRKQRYPEWMSNCLQLPDNLTADDFTIKVNGNRRQVKARVIDQTTKLVTREAILEVPVSDGRILADPSQDIAKVATLDRMHGTGKIFTGLVKGIGLKRGAIATTIAWDTHNMTIVGTNDADMAQAVNRIRELHGGIVICADGEILSEMALPIGSLISQEPMETLSQKLYHIQQTATDLGCTSPDIRLTMSVLTTAAIPFLRICEAGLVDLRQNKFVDLIVD